MGRRHRALAVALFAATCLLARGAAGEEEKCFADWSIAAPIVEKEDLVTIERLVPLVRERLGVQVVRVTLCSQDGDYVFRLVVRSREGPFRRVTLNARMPFAP
jgi:hypothetical protein